MFVVTSNSHFMQTAFPGTNGSKPWKPIVVGRHATRADAERHIARIVQASAGVVPSNRTLAIRQK